MAFFGLDAEEYDRVYNDRQLFKRILKYFRPYLKQMTIVIIFLSLSSLSNSFIPILSSIIIGNLETTRDPFYLILIIIITLILNVLAFVFNYFRLIYNAKAVGSVILDLRRNADKAVLDRDLSFFDQNPTGKIVSRVNTDSRDFGDTIYLFMQFLSSLLIVIFLLGYMVTINLIMMLLFFSIMPIFFIIALTYRKVARRATLLGQRSLANVNTIIQESLAGIQIAKTFRQEEKLYKKFNEVNEQAYKVNYRRGMILNLIFPTLNIIQGIVLALIILFGGISIFNGQINAGELYLFIQSLWYLFFPLFTIAAFWPQFQAGMSAAERIFSLIDTSPNVIQTGNQKLENFKGQIEFKNVSFEYEKNNKVLDNFSLKIKAGESLAIVGATGAGKTTIAKLIARFYEFQDGDIILDGISIRNFDLKFYRKIIGYIPQVPFLFNDTVKNNVRYGKIDATDEEISWALNKAGGSDWVDDLSEGVETNIGERGSLLSMGQRQLVALARILLEDPKIFILDEATASVDPFTEIRIQDALDEVIQQRTSIIIAHRLWTVQHVDRIIVLDHGKIVETGSHSELMEKCGIYANLYNTYFRHQSLEYIEKAKTLQNSSKK
ncbi:MAG: ABC transporter ATP-binding protein [Candidatus Lokiarchaeota archaeon]|nr:ABC transporter ATP-binding protein [Candidatus Lokiarchaeota archaeon]